MSFCPTVLPFTPFSQSRVPLDIWESIIDAVAAGDREETGWFLVNTLSCCLTCRAWAHRCRFHLFTFLTFFSEGAIAAIVRMLRLRPDLALRVKHIVIDSVRCTGDLRSQAWIPTVPASLSSFVFEKLEILYLSGMNLSLLGPQFIQSFAHFSSKYLHFMDVAVPHFGYLVDLISVTRAKTVSVRMNGHRENRVFWVDPPFRSHMSTLRKLFIGASPELLIRLPWDQFSSPFSEMMIQTVFLEKSHSENLLFLGTLQKSSILFSKLCELSTGDTIKIGFYSNHHNHILSMTGSWDPTSCRILQRLEIDPLPPFFCGIGSFTFFSDVLNWLTHASFHSIRLDLHDTRSIRLISIDASDLDSSLGLELSLRWDDVDRALTSPPFLALQHVTVGLPEYENLLGRQFECALPVLRVILPSLAVPRPEIFCNESIPCFYHQRSNTNPGYETGFTLLAADDTLDLGIL